MYLRESKQRRANGSTASYPQLAENVWSSERRRSQTQVVYNCGRADDPAVVERLRKLAASILRRCSPEEIVGAGNGDLRLVCAWPYGEVYVLQALWQRLGIDQVIRAQAQSRRLGFDVERALFAMVANRACAPCSKLYCWEQWLKEEVHIPGTHGLSLHHMYRAMDFLEANKEPIEREIFHRVADLLNLDVEVLFYDTTSLHFEIDQDDEGIGSDDLVHGSSAAGGKAYRAPRKRALSKNGRGDAPQIVVGMAVTREGFPVRHWVFPGNTVGVTTVAQVKRDLRDWQLTRCLFVGDAGMVAAANFKALAAGGGKYLMCVPMRRGDALTQQVLARAKRYRTVNERLQIKEVVIGDGERRLRYVVCFNPEEAAHQGDGLQANAVCRQQRVQPARRRALRCTGSPGAGTTVPLHHPPGAGQRTCANQRRWAGGAEVEDPLARRHHAPGDVAAGVHATAGGAGATPAAAPDPLSRSAGTERQAACDGGAARARACRAGSKARRVRGELRASPPGAAELGQAAQARVRDRPGALPELRRRAEDHRGDPAG